MMSARIPAETFPPGEFVRDEMEARGWTQGTLAEALGEPMCLVDEIIAGTRAITPETAHGLAEAFGTDPRFWMNLETAYQLWKTSHRNGEAMRRANLFEAAPIQ